MRQKLPSKQPASQPTSNPWNSLTTRELDIVLALCAGFTKYKELAKHLKVTEKTVGNHMTSILRKLRCKDKADVILKAMKEGL